MAVAFNHTIVHANNREESAAFFSEMMGLPAPDASSSAASATGPTRIAANPTRSTITMGGRGVYWCDPTGHFLEIITVPYGGWPTR